LRRRLGKFVKLFLDADVRHDLAANLAEARDAVRDRDETILIDHSDIAGRVPSVVQHLGCLLGLAQIAAHDIWPFHQQHSGSSRFRNVHCRTPAPASSAFLTRPIIKWLATISVIRHWI
jgi:hypothetical protein